MPAKHGRRDVSSSNLDIHMPLPKYERVVRSDNVSSDSELEIYPA